MWRRFLPALHKSSRKLVGSETRRACKEGDILGNEAVFIAVLLGALGRLTAVRVVAVLVRFGHELGKIAGGRDKLRILLQLSTTLLGAKPVGLLEDQPGHDV